MMRAMSTEELKVLYNEGEPLCRGIIDVSERDTLDGVRGRRVLRVLMGLSVATLLLAALYGCATVPDPNRCVQLKSAADAACTASPSGQECTALKLAYTVAGCGTYVPPVPPSCPATCPEGQECKDPAKGCVAKPTPPPVDPTPVCEPNQDCDCWVQPPGEDWKFLTCGNGKVCQSKVCRVPPPLCPVCPVGQECKDPSVGCKPIVQPPAGAGAFPQGLPDSAFTTVASTPTLHTLLNSAITEVTGCQPGSTCLTNDSPVGFMWRVNSKLREKGYAAGRHDDDNSGTITGSDEITIVKSQKGDPVCEWEGFHVVFYGVPNTVVWALPRTEPCHGHQCSGGGAYRGNFQIPDSYCDSAQPIPAPPGGSVPPPVADYGCPEPRPDRVFTEDNLPPGWGPNEIGKPTWILRSVRHNNVIDTTALMRQDEPYCASIGMSPMADGTLRAACPMRNECPSDGSAPPNDICHDRVACERYIAEGDWVTNSRNGATCVQNPENSAQFFPNNGNCQLCNPAKTVCTDWY